MMQFAVFTLLACILPSVLPDGYPKVIPETPFNTGGSPSSMAGGGGYPPVSTDYASRYRGPVAMLMVLPDGHIAETAEVTAARAAHLAALDKAKAAWAQAGAGGGSSAGGAGGYNYPPPETNSLDGGLNSGKSYLPPQDTVGGSKGASTAGSQGSTPYNGPLAMLMVLPDGHIADTAEVTAARDAHLAAIEKAKAIWSQLGHAGSSGASASGSGGYNYPQPGSNTPEGGSSYLPPQQGTGGGGVSGTTQGGASASAGSMPYSGPQAMLMVLPSGYLADTPDIAAVRAAHLSALLKAQAAWKH